MDPLGHQLHEEFGETVDLLQRHRPEMTADEAARLERRLFAPARPAPRRRHTLVVVLCLTLGLLFTTAGTGLAISGLATDGPAVRAQYPDTSKSGQPVTGSRSGGGASGAPPPVSIGDASRTSRSQPAGTKLAQADARDSVPAWFTIPILAAGILFFTVGALLGRRRRGLG